jgi:hypothetical protein
MQTTLRLKDQGDVSIEVDAYDHNGTPWYEMVFSEGQSVVEVRLDRTQLRTLIDAAIDKYGPLFYAEPDDDLVVVDASDSVIDNKPLIVADAEVEIGFAVGDWVTAPATAYMMHVVEIGERKANGWIPFTTVAYSLKDSDHFCVSPFRDNHDTNVDGEWHFVKVHGEVTRSAKLCAACTCVYDGDDHVDMVRCNFHWKNTDATLCPTCQVTRPTRFNCLGSDVV